MGSEPPWSLTLCVSPIDRYVLCALCATCTPPLLPDNHGHRTITIANQLKETHIFLYIYSPTLK